MTKDSCFEALDKLAAHFGPVSIRQKEDYFSHLRGYADAEMASAAFTLIDSRKWKGFPLVSEIRAVLDKIRFDNRSAPTAEEAAAYYDNLPCSSCGGTGLIPHDNLNYKPGESAFSVSHCQCQRGQRLAAGHVKYLADKQARARVAFERRHEPEPEGY